MKEYGDYDFKEESKNSKEGLLRKKESKKKADKKVINKVTSFMKRML